MRYFLETMGILLAGAGLFMLGWLALGRLLAPLGIKAPLLAVLPADGDGETLEHDVRSLLWLRENAMTRLVVVIADCGLSQEGRCTASLLARREEHVLLCPAAEVADLIDPRTGSPKPL